MRLIANKRDVDAAALLAALFNLAKHSDSDVTMTMEQAQGFVNGSGGHCDFDMLSGRTIRMSVNPVTREVRLTELYDVANGKGRFAEAVEVALKLEAEAIAAAKAAAEEAAKQEPQW